MSDVLPKMTVQEYADIEMAFGQKIIKVNSVYWRRVRPLFYRPILSFVEYPSELVTVPRAAFLGGAQHVLPSPDGANSCMKFLMFDDLKKYSLDSITYDWRRKIRLASKHFVIRPVYEIKGFKNEGYKAYLEFFERTRYRYKSERRKQSHFNMWVDTLFRFPKAIVLGGYGNTGLNAVSVSYLVEDVLIYATFFCNNESLRLNVSDLMIHSIRDMAAKSQSIRYIFTGLYHGQKGMDDFYLLRGCKIITKPALFRINPLTLFLLRNLMPKQYGRLCGQYEEKR